MISSMSQASLFPGKSQETWSNVGSQGVGSGWASRIPRSRRQHVYQEAARGPLPGGDRTRPLSSSQAL